MPDKHYEHPRLAAIYDAIDSDRGDLDAYPAIAEELQAHSVVDVGCGTGVLALLLAARGYEVTGLDPAAASLDVARSKPGAEHVRWIGGEISALPPMQVDLATMTGNAAQAVVDPADWDALLAGVAAAVRPGGHFVFESRDPAYQAWREWDREESHAVIDIPGVGAVQTWFDLLDVDGELVTFRATYVFAADGAELSSESTLRFRSKAQIEADLDSAGFDVVDVRDAPDRPRREFVFLARRR